jgi:hypothetical protein
MKLIGIFAVVIKILCLGGGAKAQVTYSGTTSADAFLATGSPTNPEGADLTGLNFGAAGLLVVAPASSTNGEFQTVMKFNLANAVGLFNTNYGAGNWAITGISLNLASNNGTNGTQPDNAMFPVVAGGQFVIEWLSDDAWVEGTGKPNQTTTDGVTYNSLPDLLSGAREIVSTNTYAPPDNNVPIVYPLPLNTNLVNDVAAGGDVSLRLYAADNQIAYLFNSHEFGRGNQPLITVTATPRQPWISAAYFTNANFHVTGMGLTNALYQIQANPGLQTTNWQTIGSAMSDGAGLIQFDDVAAAGQGTRLYRLAK